MTFNAVSQAAGIAAGSARGSATADYDHDGDLDLAIVSQSGALQLYQNNSTNIGRWIVINLLAKESNLDAIGSVIKVQTEKSQQQHQVKGGNSAHSQSSLNVHFGLANEEMIDRIIVDWPSGRQTVLKAVKTNQYLMIYEDDTIFIDGFE